MTSQDQAFENLRHAIVKAIGRNMTTSRDFDFLAAAIFEKLHQSVSISTLKRFWGYLPQYSSTRVSTLDLLAQFVDYKDWEDFCRPAQAPVIANTDEALENHTSPSFPVKPWYRHTSLMVASVVVLLVVGATVLFRFLHAASDDDPRYSYAATPIHILRRGQIFEQCSDYLRLFGVTSPERYWDQPLPHHEGIIIWGPEYHHPQWHNEGERDSLMPTITEWWEPSDDLNDAKERELLMAERNEHLYFTVTRTRELRITFMKNLIDTGYVFLGVYRTNLELSDSNHVVWERVADECDLGNLAYLEQLRH